MDLHETALHWADQLTWADNLLPADPTAAFDSHRSVAEAIEDYVLEHPESRPELATLLCRARVELERSAQESARFTAETRERERHFNAREHATATLPLQALRHPWPPPGA